MSLTLDTPLQTDGADITGADDISLTYATAAQAEALSASAPLTAAKDRYAEISRRPARILRAPVFKGKLGQEITSLLIWGDSYGQFVTANPQSEHGPLWQLWRQYGFRGAWIGTSASNVPGFGYALAGGAVAQVTKDFSAMPNGDVFFLPSTGASVQFGASIPGTPYFGNKLTAVYKIQTGGGTLQWQTKENGVSDWVDSGSPINMATGTNGTLATTFITCTKDASFAARLISTSGSAVVCGALMEDTANTTGVIVSMWARGGLDLSAQANTIPAANLAVLLGLIVPDLVVQTFADTDITTSYPAQTTLWNSARSGMNWIYNAPIFGLPEDSGSVGDTRNDAIISHALSTGQEYWDMRLILRNYAYALAAGLMFDTGHLNSKGGEIISEAFWNALGVLQRQHRPSVRPVAAATVDAVTLSQGGVGITDLIDAMATTAMGAGGLVLASGSGGRVVNANPLTSVGTGPFALAMWIKMPDAVPSGNCSIFAIRPTTGLGQQATAIWASLSATGVLNFDWWQATTSDSMRLTVTNSSLAPYFGKTILLSFRRTAAGDVRIEINGVRIDYAVALFGAGVMSGSLNVGSQYVSAGYLASVQTAQVEVLQLAWWSVDQLTAGWMTGGKPPGSPTLFWTFREGAGDNTKDLSGNGNHAVAVAHTWRRPISNGSTTLTADATLSINTAHVINKSGSRCVGTLPAAPAAGDFVEVRGLSSNGWKVAQPAGHQIVEGAGGTIGTNATTAGTGGYIQSGARYDAVVLRCIVSDSVTPSYIWTLVKNATPTWA